MSVDRMNDLEAKLNTLHDRLAWLESIPAIADFKKAFEQSNADTHAQGLARNRAEEVAEERRMRAAGRVPMITLPGEKSPGVQAEEDSVAEAVQEPGPEQPASNEAAFNQPIGQRVPPPPFQ